MLLRPSLEPADEIKPLVNVGATLDVPYGYYLKGMHGENILNGGASFGIGVVGKENMFKSTFMEFLFLTVCARMGIRSMDIYDTEMNVHRVGLMRFIRRIEQFHGEDIFASGRLVLTDGTKYFGNKWYEVMKDYFKSKIEAYQKGQKEAYVELPFVSGLSHARIRIPVPSATAMDSFSEFKTEDVMDIADKNEIGDSKRNTIHMRQGLSKYAFLSEMPYYLNSASHWLFMTAQLGKEMMQDPYASPTANVRLQHLRNNDKIMSVTRKFTYLTTDCFHVIHASVLRNQGSKGPEYPRHPGDEVPMDPDLNMIQVQNLRGKAGMSGQIHEILVSQKDGILPTMTEFNYLKKNKHGIEGNDRSYALELYPDCKLSRTTVRSKIDDDARLRRAMNITSELLQHEMLNNMVLAEVVPPAQLRMDLEKAGYNWDQLLDTRGWWAPVGVHDDIPFLSTKDLLLMRTGEYIPYWMSDSDKEKIKKHFNK